MPLGLHLRRSLLWLDAQARQNSRQPGTLHHCLQRKRQAQEVAKMRAGRVRMMQEQAAAKAQQGSTLEGIMDR